ncbi:hypothetical protein ACVW0W_004022 [Bradyrhizobium sp. USDA 4469]
MTSTPTAFTQSSNHRVERFGELGLTEVVLILADADCLGLDLDELGERILKTAGDRDRAAQGDVEVGQLLGGESGGRIDRRAGFRHHDLGHLQLGETLDEIACELVGFARGGAVADRDQLDAVLDGELAEDRE